MVGFQLFEVELKERSNISEIDELVLFRMRDAALHKK